MYSPGPSVAPTDIENESRHPAAMEPKSAETGEKKKNLKQRKRDGEEEVEWIARHVSNVTQFNVKENYVVDIIDSMINQT